MHLIPWRRKREHMHHQDQADTSLGQLRSEMTSLLDRFFQDPWESFAGGSPLAGLTAFPRTDLAESENQVTVTMELPGVDAKDLDITVTGGLLSVCGEKRHEREEKQKNYHYVERQFGGFRRSVQLPSSVDPSKVEATCKDGVLTVTIGKHPDAKPKRIAVTNA